MYISNPSAAGEGAGFWRSVRAVLTNRGVQDILITCCDGLAGFENTIASAFPQTLPRCVVQDAGLPVMPTSRRELVAGGLTSCGKVSMIAVAWSTLAFSVVGLG